MPAGVRACRRHCAGSTAQRAPDSVLRALHLHFAVRDGPHAVALAHEVVQLPDVLSVVRQHRDGARAILAEALAHELHQRRGAGRELAAAARGARVGARGEPVGGARARGGREDGWRAVAAREHWRRQ